ncbi:glutathione S-transferase N-terminal domain-containing protein [Sphingomonas naphthae]|uniref:Glutathione S-transferase N-terminal domain-containing protein n=1 Tax=Sphingomonas naphthae TaxID=1813468 RepID=A0ABY7TLP3_9SPHN|nr:glutathione S-transferase N-terminal domain-containing protein [Sphingomonas naphthae]WCT74162.1 glutathione S-transferase N-terminal domain-containing protein [Sphingomonas naphthae]
MSLTLYCSPTSPFARKVRIALIELGLHDRVEEIVVNPFVWREGRAPLAEWYAIVSQRPSSVATAPA